MKAQFLFEDAFNITGRGIVITGRIESGEIETGDMINIGGDFFKIKGRESFRGSVGYVGKNVGLLIQTKLTKEELMKFRKQVCEVTNRDERIDSILK
jgi:translation elongation factor EF-Tu-like GTPase